MKTDLFVSSTGLLMVDVSKGGLRDFLEKLSVQDHIRSGLIKPMKWHVEEGEVSMREVQLEPDRVVGMEWVKANFGGGESVYFWGEGWCITCTIE